MIFIVEDDTNIRQMESYALRSAGFQVCEFENGDSFFAALEAQLPRLVVLDIMLPGSVDGLEILARLRASPRTRDIQVVMVTAKATEMDAVRGLDSGADDYISKPFGVLEFISRIKAVLRRGAGPEGGQPLALGQLELDVQKRTVFCGGQLCELTFKEHELLHYFMQNPGIVLSRNQIMDKVWGFDFQGESRTVDMHVKTLRQKLGPCGTMIKTVRNVGYKIEP